MGSQRLFSSNRYIQITICTLTTQGSRAKQHREGNLRKMRKHLLELRIYSLLRSRCGFHCGHLFITHLHTAESDSAKTLAYLCPLDMRGASR